MSKIAFKESKVTRAGLLEMGKLLSDVKDQADKLNETLTEFNKSPKNLFDDNEIEIGTRYLEEAIEYVQMKLGALEMKEMKKK